MTSPPNRRTLLLVDDEEDLREVLHDLLTTSGFRVVTAADGREALSKWPAGNPDLVILDVMLPDLSGFEVCKSIKARAAGHLPVILLTARGDVESMEDGLLVAAADDYVVKPFRHRELVARIHACLRVKDLHDVIRKQNEFLNQLSITDDLTGLYNHRYLTRKLDERVKALHQTAGALTCALIDLNQFKSINDLYGHLTGDEVLRRFAEFLKSTLPAGHPPAICGRWGGDEFLIIFSDGTPPASWESGLTELLKKNQDRILGNLPPPKASREKQPAIGLSGGMAVVSGPDPALDAVQIMADLDTLLYRAKDGNGSRIETAAPNSIGRRRDRSRAGPARPTGQVPLIYVLEDDPDICSIIGDMLARQKVEAQIFQETPKMLEALKAAVPDLILLDLKLSDADGMDVCRQIRRKPEFSGTKISFLTAFTSEDIKQEAMACGGDAFLMKPFTYSKFVQEIQRLLGQKI